MSTAVQRQAISCHQNSNAMDIPTLCDLRTEHADNLQRLRVRLDLYVKGRDGSTPEGLRQDLRREERYIAALDEILSAN